jgi:hypothetical protein
MSSRVLVLTKCLNAERRRVVVDQLREQPVQVPAFGELALELLVDDVGQDLLDHDDRRVVHVLAVDDLLTTGVDDLAAVRS